MTRRDLFVRPVGLKKLWPLLAPSTSQTSYTLASAPSVARPLTTNLHQHTMAFLLRRPFAVTSALKQTVPKSTQTISARAFHNQRSHFFTPKSPSVAAAHNVAKYRYTFRRSYQQAAYNPVAQGNMRQRLLYGGAIFGGTLLASMSSRSAYYSNTH
jgi:hypothetical protein